MKSAMKKTFAVLAVSAMMTTAAAYAAASELPTTTAQPIVIAQPITLPITVEVQELTLPERGYQKSAAQEPMLPLRAVAESLGFTLAWNPETMSVDLAKDNVFTTVQTGVDQYTINKTYTSLGTAPELVDSKLYVPASFVSKVLRGSVTTEGSTVSIQLQGQKKVQSTGVITAIRQNGDHAALHIQGAGMDGIILNVDKDTQYRMLDGTELSLADLHIGLTVSGEHSAAVAQSLPPQTAASRITVLDAARQADLIGTAGEVQELRKDENGGTSVVIKGEGLSETSPDEVVLQLTEQTSVIGRDGDTIEPEAIAKGSRVIGFYQPVMTKSLPPIGKAWKIVVEPDADWQP